MPVLPWLNANRNRSFPFLKGSVARPGAGAGTVDRLADEVVVDAGFVAGPSSGFAPESDDVYLDKVRRLGPHLYFDFRSNAPGLADVVLTFARDVSAGEYQTEFAEAFDPAYQTHAGDSESVSASDTFTPDLGEAGACFQMTSAGTLVAPVTGRLRLYFNDEIYVDNTGSLAVTIGGHVYSVPAYTGDGVDGPLVTAGHSYPYAATGIVVWRVHDNKQSNAAGPTNYAPADPAGGHTFLCPGLIKWSLVGKFFLEKPAFSESERDDCPPEPALSGYLVTGRLATVLAALPGDGQIGRTADDAAVVEPALVQTLAGGYVTSINLANADRVRATPPPGCDAIDWGFPVGAGRLFVAAQCLRGDVRLKPGFNSVVRQETDAGRVTLGAAPGAGEGPACEEVPLFPEEVPPPGSNLLEGGPSCVDVLRSINGSGGRFAALVGGQGVRVTADAAHHTVVVDVNMNRMAICRDDAFSEVSESV